LYIIAVVCLSAVPSFFWAETSWLANGSFTSHPLFGGIMGLGSPGSVILGVVLMLGLGGIATYVPLRIGKRAFDKLEF